MRRRGDKSIDRGKHANCDTIHKELSGDENLVPLKFAILAVFLFYRYKFLSRVKDKNCTDCRVGQEDVPITDLTHNQLEFNSYFIKLTGSLMQQKRGNTFKSDKPLISIEDLRMFSIK